MSYCLIRFLYSLSSIYSKSLLISISVDVSFVEPKLVFRNLLKSSSLNLPYPSAMFNGIDTAALLN